MKVKLSTNFGDMEIELNPEKAPNTVKNFLSYVEKEFYNGLIFHRVIENFMIQGGGFTPDMEQKDPLFDSIENEADNGLENSKGSIAMARTGEPHSATCQFFINVKDNAFLDHQAKTPQGWGYCVFGKLSAGEEVMEKIKSVETGNFAYHQDVPNESVVIEKVELA